MLITECPLSPHPCPRLGGWILVYFQFTTWLSQAIVRLERWWRGLNPRQKFPFRSQIGLTVHCASAPCPQQGDLRLSDPPSGKGAGGGVEPATEGSLQISERTTEPPTPPTL
ncbi:hypothetical protein PoB_001004000 [Plakobranchus ocellatus]|uniref:Uncharacterized protein n=1 Tax=Plakobranchus ocellatus TaxID=259542 RepID=A0AAV3YLD5_9GAST|nr:hypothetical protein PoB_001004000 [Plakobranchus ocellatus]